MRELFVADLVCDILGPRGGVRERMTESPLSEYITGVLSPIVQSTRHDVEAGAELPSEDTRETEETFDTDDTAAVMPFAPVLNPQARPFSMGISFVLGCNGAGTSSTIHICLTWARYLKRDDGHGAVWNRVPRFVVNPPIDASRNHVMWFDGNGGLCNEGDAGVEVSLHVVSRATTTNGHRLISVFLVNRVRTQHADFVPAEDHIFQPQIRVVSGPDCSIVPGFNTSSTNTDDRRLAFLYRSHPVLARGHLTSAIWAAIDPQRLAGHDVDFPDSIRRSPFAWEDGYLLTDEARERFALPDVRTEFVPVVPISMPELNLRAGAGVGTELDAVALAEIDDPELLRNALTPLLTAYRDWIALQPRETDPPIATGEEEMAAELMAACETVADRIEAGIDLLHRDAEARLSFCFAMRAMALQHEWASKGQERLRWRPFQLAFILLAIESIVDPESEDRNVCDLLWVPTGGGKTEAYLALLAFTIGIRRRRALRRAAHSPSDRTGAGVAVISRYTLRLLTIQQFRRTLRLITACECLRVDGLSARLSVGWRPTGYQSNEPFLWGTVRFSAGLWVGSGVAPNKLEDSWAGRNIPGALETLRNPQSRAENEPAQVLRCPACDSVLAIPGGHGEAITAAGYTIHLIVQGPVGNVQQLVGIAQNDLTIRSAQYAPLTTQDFGTLTLRLGGARAVNAETFDALWGQAQQILVGVSLACARAARPGYFLRFYSGRAGAYDFDVLCPAPECNLNRRWCEGTPAGHVHRARAEAVAPAGGVNGIPRFVEPTRLAHVNDAFQAGSPFVCERVPIPAYTVDDQVYHRCPSVVIATADKFARPPFEPRAAALFGNVTHHHCVFGYYREGLHYSGSAPHPSPGGRGRTQTWCAVTPFDPPDLVLQDELHLIEGPLGSLAGMYETAFDTLCANAEGRPIKYIASTATIRQAEEQVRSVYNRELTLFPPPGLTADDSFFVRIPQRHSLRDKPPGRLYVGVCAPGRGPLTPILRMWARMLQTAAPHAAHPDIDPYWTLAGYFNAIRELAGARALYRQDIPERIDLLSRLDGLGIAPRPLPEDRVQELSGRMDSTDLPVVLGLLNEAHGQDALFTTSMFGTGVDVPRLSLMIVNGQPKTTSSYIQATGRVGRRTGALVPIFLRSTRPRDLNHYEFFCGYHVQMHRFVEPITVMPFAPGVRDRALGPVGVFILRSKRNTVVQWSAGWTPRLMGAVRTTDQDVMALPALFEQRAASQPTTRRPASGAVLLQTNSALDDWHAVAQRQRAALEYVEYKDVPTAPVVLGDAQHQHAGLEIVYENVPQSLREIEDTCGFQT